MRHPWIHRLLTRLFPLEEINGADRCPTYLYRWVLLTAGSRFSIYLHRFVADDWSLDLHDHPKPFTSIGLWGCYAEHQPGNRVRLYQAPWFRRFPARHIHRVTLLGADCWTLVIVGRRVREWGFWHEDGPTDSSPTPTRRWRWIPWKQYVIGSDAHLADDRKACA